MSDELNDKQFAFCREYVIDFNGTQAAIRAGYSEKTADQQASRLLTNVKVACEVQRLVEEAAKRSDITIDRVLKELAAIAFLDPIDIFDEDGKLMALSDMPEQARRAIGGIQIEKRREGQGDSTEYIDVAKLKLLDKNNSLEKLGKYLGMFVERVDHTTKGESINNAPTKEVIANARRKARESLQDG